MSVITSEPRLLYRDMRTRAQEIVDEHIKTQVLAGIEVLNEKYGPDWVDDIDPTSLYLESGSACVLGQLYGEYDTGVRRLLGDDYQDEERSNEEWGEQHGFYRGDGEYDSLTEAWRAVLADV